MQTISYGFSIFYALRWSSEKTKKEVFFSSLMPPAFPKYLGVLLKLLAFLCTSLPEEGDLVDWEWDLLRIP